jgi:hypothetical protein
MNNPFILFSLLAGLMYGTYGFGQDSTRSSLAVALEKVIVNYQQNFPKEEIYLHLDRLIYLSGENIWFTAYARNAEDNKLPSVSGVIYADIVSPNGQIIASAKIKLSGNKGSGQFYLSDSLPTGSYQVRTYSNWMKNFNASHIFVTKILIINRFSENEIPVSNTTENLPVACYFYPEGSFTAYEKPTRIAFKLIDTNKKGLNIWGWIIDETGTKITELHPLHAGIGSFDLSMLPSKSYFALFEANGKEYRFPLANLPINDYSIKTENLSGKIHIRVSYSGNSRLKANSKLFIIGIPRGSKPFVLERKLLEGKLSEYLPSASEGVMQIFVVDDHEMVLSDRMVYSHSVSLPKLSCSTDKTQYGNREKVSLKIWESDSTSLPIRCNVSISVSDFPNTYGLESGGQEVFSYLMLQSGFSDEIEDPSWYFESTDQSREEALDNLLITLTGKKLKWEVINDMIPQPIRYCTESSGIILSGQAIDSRTGKGISGVGLLLSSPDTIPVVKYALTDDNGAFRFLLDNYYGSKDLVIQTDDISRSEHLSLVLNDNLLPVKAVIQNPLITNDSTISRYIMKAIRRSRINKTYQVNPVAENFMPESGNTLKAYGYPDEIIYPDEFVKLPGFEEIVVEIVPAVSMKKRKDSYYFQIANREMGTINKKSTLLVDGIPVQNPVGMLKWDSDKIKKIEICYWPRLYGDWMMGGVLSIFTSKGGCPLELPGILYRKTWDGFLVEKYFQFPAYHSEENKSSPRPDFRGLLYWNPQVQIGPSGSRTIEFNTSDESGTYYVNLEGITSDGTPVKTSIPLIVKRAGRKEKP